MSVAGQGIGSTTRQPRAAGFSYTELPCVAGFGELVDPAAYAASARRLGHRPRGRGHLDGSHRGGPLQGGEYGRRRRHLGCGQCPRHVGFPLRVRRRRRQFRGRARSGPSGARRPGRDGVLGRQRTRPALARCLGERRRRAGRRARRPGGTFRGLAGRGLRDVFGWGPGLGRTADEDRGAGTDGRTPGRAPRPDGTVLPVPGHQSRERRHSVPDRQTREGSRRGRFPGRAGRHPGARGRRAPRRPPRPGPRAPAAMAAAKPRHGGPPPAKARLAAGGERTRRGLPHPADPRDIRERRRRSASFRPIATDGRWWRIRISGNSTTD